MCGIHGLAFACVGKSSRGHESRNFSQFVGIQPDSVFPALVDDDSAGACEVAPYEPYVYDPVDSKSNVKLILSPAGVTQRSRDTLAVIW